MIQGMLKLYTSYKSLWMNGRNVQEIQLHRWKKQLPTGMIAEPASDFTREAVHLLELFPGRKQKHQRLMIQDLDIHMNRNNKNHMKGKLPILFCFILLFCFTNSCIQNKNTTEKENTTTNSVQYIFDMVHNNPAEGPTQSIYTNPGFLKDRGFNGMVPQWHIQCGLTYDSFEKGIIPEGSKERQWVLNKQQFV